MEDVGEDGAMMTECGPMCGRCYDEGVELVPSPCQEDPMKLAGTGVGMYHCPECGAMILAGVPHPTLCIPCSRQQHPYFDAKLEPEPK